MSSIRAKYLVNKAIALAKDNTVVTSRDLKEGDGLISPPAESPCSVASYPSWFGNVLKARNEHTPGSRAEESESDDTVISSTSQSSYKSPTNFSLYSESVVSSSFDVITKEPQTVQHNSIKNVLEVVEQKGNVKSLVADYGSSSEGNSPNDRSFSRGVCLAGSDVVIKPPKFRRKLFDDIKTLLTYNYNIDEGQGPENPEAPTSSSTNDVPVQVPADEKAPVPLAGDITYTVDDENQRLQFLELLGNEDMAYINCEIGELCIIDSLSASPKRAEPGSPKSAEPGSPKSAEPGSPLSAELDTPNIIDPGTGTRKRKRINVDREQNTRKRRRNPADHKWTIYHKNVQSGKEHHSRSGNLIAEKTVQRSCGSSCRFQCSTKVTEDERHAIFDQFWKLPDQSCKWNFIARHMKVFNKEVNKEKKNRRGTSREYFFRVRGQQVKICKTMFCSTLDISGGCIETTVKKLGEGGHISPDKRGKHQKRFRKIPENVKMSVRDHINSFPRVESHYVRANTTRQFLEPTLNCRKMHDLYLEWVAKEGKYSDVIKPATERQYRDIFNYEFNLSFHKPRKDQCDLCTEWKNAPNNSQEMQRVYEDHQRNKTLARELKGNDAYKAKDKKSNSNLSVSTFDFEKILICPKAETSALYYRRKYHIANLTIYDIGRHEGHCYVYDESTANKGGTEVGSFLDDFIRKKNELGVDTFIFYSDNCIPQNKNKLVLTALLRAAAKYNVRIIHRFLEKGHTQNEGDSVHARIERYTRNDDIWCPTEWYQKIREAKRSKKNPYRAIEVTQDNILNFGELAEKLNFAKDESGEPFRVSHLRETFFDCEKPGILQYKVQYEEDYRTLSTKKRGHPVNLKTYAVGKAYSSKLGVSKEKLDDLHFLCEKNVIPAQYHDFYYALLPAEVNREVAVRGRQKRQNCDRD